MASASGAASSSPGAPNVPQGSSDTQLIVVAELMLSASPELDSAEQGKLAAGALVHKLEVNTLSDGTERVLVGTVDHSKPLGWISAVSSTGTKSLKTAPPPRAAPAGTGGDGGTKSRNSTGTGGAKGSSGSSVGSKEWSAAVEACVLFDGHRSLAEQRFMFQSAKKIPTTEGAVLYAQGDFPSMLYLVHSGRYRATIRTGGASIIARDYGPADTFGACELLGTYGGRTCTVTVLAAGVVWGVPQRVVSEKLKIAPASSVPGLLAFCQQVSLFGCLSKERLVQFCRGARQRHLAAGEVLCSHGDAARSLYVVHSGYVHTSQPGSDFSLTMQPPQVFGESALFGESETRIRQATITAGEGGATVLTWSVAAVEALCGYELQQRSMALFTCKFLESVQVCGRLLASELSASQLETLATAVMEVATFADGDVIAAEGELDRALLVIKSGSAHVRKGNNILTTLERGDAVGEHALLRTPEQVTRRQKRRTTLVAHNPGESGGSGSAVVALALSAAALEEACADDPLLDAWWARLSSDVLLHHGSGVTHGADSAIARRVSVAGGNLQGLLGREARAPKEGDRRSQRGGGRAKGAGDSGGGGITGVIRRASVRLGLTPAPGGPEDKEEGAFAVLGSALRRASQFGMDSLTAFNSKGKKGGRTNTNIKM